MKQLIFAALLLLSSSAFSQTISIAEARSKQPGSIITVAGIVTNGSELGTIRYMQDATAGIAAFPGTGSVAGFAAAVKEGDSLLVTGTLVDFNGLLELSPIASFQVLASGKPLPAPKVLSGLNEITEALESQLVSVPCVGFPTAGATFSASGTYDIADSDANTSRIFLRNSHPLIGTAVPTSPVLLTAISGEYIEKQLLPRYAADLVAQPCFYFTQNLRLDDFQQNSLSFSWKTNLLSASFLQWGATPALGQTINLTTPSLNHSTQINNLQAGNVYWVQVLSIHQGDTIRSEVRPFTTVSASSGRIKVLFNHAIDDAIAAPYVADGLTFDDCLQEIINRIDSACCSIDVSVYNNNRDEIVDRLKAAAARGVQVRYVAAVNGSSFALDPPPPFPVIYGNEAELMHNKFLVCDANDANKAWVLTGSMNWTTDNIEKDFNNVICIQDQSLARAYQLEFQEMWGSSGAQPDTTRSRFGAEKLDNTPHQFRIGQAPVYSYFSPSDGTSARIIDAMGTANQSLLFAQFSFTRNDIGNAVLDAWNRGVQVRGMIENIGDQGSEYAYLSGLGLPVYPHTVSNSLHHKYAVVDAELPGSEPLVVTGSHNWSQVAEEGNDENTLIIQDARVARLFWAEFERRWAENSTSTQDIPTAKGWSVYPNPGCDQLQMRQADPSSQTVSYRVYDAGGQLWLTGFGQNGSTLATTPLPAGWYTLLIIGTDGATSIPFQKICR
ncbi:MAG: phospholipase D-like domain-containing protein [Saprospiraceae bacterium]